MSQIQLINSVRTWEKRLEIEDEQRKYDHQRFSNGCETILKRTGRDILNPYTKIFQGKRKQQPISCCGSREDWHKMA